MFFKGYRVATPSAALIILCFFLPWALISCEGQPMAELSGWELAAGTTVDMGLGAQRVEGRPLFFVIPAAAGVVIALAYLAQQRKKLTGADMVGVVAAGIIPIVILLIEFSRMKEETAGEGMTVDFLVGLWGVGIGLVGLIIGGLLNTPRNNSMTDDYLSQSNFD